LLWIVLAISVFVLGLQSKLSLYSSSRSVSNRAPVSKLLSPEEQAGVDRTEASADAPRRGVFTTTLLVGLVAAFAFFIDCQLAALFRQTRESIGGSHFESPFLRGLASAFLRPPPAISL
jgi:hypothetical protein